MSKQNKRPELTMDDLEQITFDALRHCGMTPPMTIDEVAAIEAELTRIELPFAPSDPYELLKRLVVENEDTARTVIPFPQTSADSVMNLARAAREGGTLSAEVEQQMAADKARYIQSEHGKE